MLRWVLAGLSVLVIVLVTVVVLAAQRDRAFEGLVASGATALESGDSSTAVEAFSGAIALRPDSMLAHLRRGEAYQLRGDLPAALKDLKRATELDPAAPRAQEALGDVDLGLGRAAAAAERYQASLAIDERSGRVLYKLALARLELQQLTPALEAANRAIELEPRLAEAHYAKGLCELELGDLEGARRSFEQAVESDGNLEVARHALARVAAERGAAGDELAQLEALAALRPDEPGRHVMLAVAYQRAGQLDAARLHLQRAVERAPDNPDLQTALGEAWLRLAEQHGDQAALGNAAAALERASGLTRPSGRTLGLLGRVRLLLGEPEAALALLERAAHLPPVDPSMLASLAAVARQLDHPATERDALSRLDVLVGDAAPVLVRAVRTLRIAEIDLVQGHTQLAAEALGRLAGQPPAEPALTARLVTMLEQAGCWSDARVVLERAVKAFPSDPTILRLARERAVP